MIRRFPNGETYLRIPQVLVSEYIACKGNTRGTETSKYPEEEKEKFDFLSSGERTGKSPNRIYPGLRTQQRIGLIIVEESWEASQYKVIAL